MAASIPGAQVKMNNGEYKCQAVYKPQVDECTAGSGQREEAQGVGLDPPALRGWGYEKESSGDSEMRPSSWDDLN